MDQIYFRDRKDAGKRLAELLETYSKKSIVYALPRGGVAVASVVAEKLSCPLDVIAVKKIGHPDYPEFAVGAITSSGIVVGDRLQLGKLDQEWLRVEMGRKQKEARRALSFYSKGLFNQYDQSDKIALIVDDGVATGSTILAATQEVKLKNPKKIIIGIPVMPKEAKAILEKVSDGVVSVLVPDFFLGAVGAYYDEFEQIDDLTVLKLLERNKRLYERTEDQRGNWI